MAGEAKLDTLFPTAQFLMQAFINRFGWVLLQIVEVC